MRVFNTYGPRLDPDDGRVVSNFLVQALAGEPLTSTATAARPAASATSTTRSDGILALLDSGLTGPVNIGNPNEFTMLELADEVRLVTGADVEVRFEPLPQDDPKKRLPDITIARRAAGLGTRRPATGGPGADDGVVPPPRGRPAAPVSR